MLVGQAREPFDDQFLAVVSTASKFLCAFFALGHYVSDARAGTHPDTHSEPIIGTLDQIVDYHNAFFLASFAWISTRWALGLPVKIL